MSEPAQGKVAFFTMPDSRFGAAVLRTVLQHDPNSIDLVVISSRVEGKGSLPGKLWRIGTHSGFRFLLWKIGDTLRIRFGSFRAERPAVLAARHGIETVHVKNANHKAFIESLQERGIRWIVVASFNQILKPRLLDTFPERVFNLHPSALPKYRGRAAFFWVIGNNEPQVGVTLHMTVPELDAGDIVGQTIIDRPIHATPSDLKHELGVHGGALINRHLAGIRAADFPRTPQDHTQATYYSQPTKAERRRYNIWTG